MPAPDQFKTKPAIVGQNGLAVKPVKEKYCREIARPPARNNQALLATAKLSPQPHSSVTLGLLNSKV